MKIEFLRNTSVRGQAFEVADVADLEDDDALNMINMGKARLADNSKKVKNKAVATKKKSTATTKRKAPAKKKAAKK